MEDSPLPDMPASPGVPTAGAPAATLPRRGRGPSQERDALLAYPEDALNPDVVGPHAVDLSPAVIRANQREARLLRVERMRANPNNGRAAREAAAAARSRTEAAAREGRRQAEAQRQEQRQEERREASARRQEATEEATAQRQEERREATARRQEATEEATAQRGLALPATVVYSKVKHARGRGRPPWRAPAARRVPLVT